MCVQAVTCDWINFGCHWFRQRLVVVDTRPLLELMLTL